MTNQADLFGEPPPAPRKPARFDRADYVPPHQKHSPTSLAAAVHALPKAGTKRAIVLDHIKACGDMGATDEEMQLRIPMVPNTQRPRRVELMQANLIEEAKFTRTTLSGMDAVVWVACT